MRGVSIDIGSKNFAICIEDFDVKELQSLENIPLKSRYFSKTEKEIAGKATPKFLELLKKVYTNGVVILSERVDLTLNGKRPIDIFCSLTAYLDSKRKLLDDADFVIIEEQFQTKHKGSNPFALKLEQHTFSWFTFIYHTSKDIILFPSKNKTKVLGAPIYVDGKKMSKPQRKKWSVEVVTEILGFLRKDIPNTKNIMSSTKKDDLSDTILQLQAFKYMTFVDRKI